MHDPLAPLLDLPGVADAVERARAEAPADHGEAVYVAFGVVLQLPFTHEVLAEVVGAQRPSLTTGISTLEQRGLISREDGHFVLHGEPPAELGAQDAVSLQA